jgi:predicted acetyltransferase
MTAATVVLATPEQEGLIHGFLSAYLAELGVQSAYPYLPLYWREPGRYPYVIVANSELVGFALVRTSGVGPQFEMAEFYVMPSHRRIGIGRRAACELFVIHCGDWQVKVMPGSPQAESFWASVLPARAIGRRSSVAYERPGT